MSMNERRYCLGPIGREFDTIAKEKEQFPKMTVIVPPMASARRLEMANPNPVP